MVDLGGNTHGKMERKGGRRVEHKLVACQDICLIKPFTWSPESVLSY